MSYGQGLGNRLWSHVNLTETINSLSMITKAGVSSNMTVVGQQLRLLIQAEHPGLLDRAMHLYGARLRGVPGPLHQHIWLHLGPQDW
jgi:hypothetical protein